MLAESDHHDHAARPGWIQLGSLTLDGAAEGERQVGADDRLQAPDHRDVPAAPAAAHAEPTLARAQVSGTRAVGDSRLGQQRPVAPGRQQGREAVAAALRPPQDGPPVGVLVDAAVPLQPRRPARDPRRGAVHGDPVVGGQHLDVADPQHARVQGVAPALARRRGERLRDPRAARAPVFQTLRARRAARSVRGGQRSACRRGTPSPRRFGRATRPSTRAPARAVPAPVRSLRDQFSSGVQC